MDEIELTYIALNTAFDVLMGSYSNLSLVGAYAIEKGLREFGVDYSRVGRLTYGIDFSSYYYSLDELNYADFQRDIINRLGSSYHVTFYPIKVRDTSVTYSFRVTYNGVSTRMLRVGFSLKDGVKRFEIQPLRVILATKIKLCNDFVDRRLKDKIDAYFLLNFLYKDGVSKMDLFELLISTGSAFQVNKDWLSFEEVFLAIDSGKKFSGVDLFTVQSAIMAIQSLLSGLYSENISMEAVFHQGGWVSSGNY